MPVEPLLSIQELTKEFPGVIALDHVSLDIEQGETHVLLGENGAGKSTLVKILSGVYHASSGDILFEGNPYQPSSTREALHAGVRLIHQEFNLLNYLSVAENIFFDKLPNSRGFVNFRELSARTSELLDEVGLDLSPDTPVEQLSIAQMQMVEIAKALSGESKLLIMDEPTASLTNKEINKLFEIIKRLKERGVTIIYISHRLQEIFEIGDRVSILRNGELVVTRPLEGLDVDGIVKLMVGRELTEGYPFRTDVLPGRERLRVEALQPRDSSERLSFSVHAGELVGIAGLVGAGRTEILRAIFGADKPKHGNIYLDGEALKIRHPRDAVQHGISFVTENRKEEGLLLNMPCTTNISITNLAAISKAGLLQEKVEQAAATRLTEEVTVKTPSIHQLVRNLSGGNQQKVVIAKWLFRNAKLLMIDEPTRGIDVGARAEIYHLLWDLAAEGKAILIVSSDLPELMGICHRIMVLSKGKITGVLERSEFDEERILGLAFQEYSRERLVAA